MNNNMNNMNNTMITHERWQDWLTLLIGIWIFITPWIFGFARTDFAWSPFIMGALVFIFSIWAVVNRRIVAEGINLIIAIWIFISPWILGFSHTPNAAWIMFIFGAILIIVEIWGIGITKNAMQKPGEIATVQTS